MPRPFRFAVQLMDLQDPAAIAAAASTAASLGYEQLFSYDHIGAVDPFVPLMTAATAAPKLDVGPLVLNNELHHPALLARTAATTDRMVGGRLVLGIGTGYMQSEHDATGIELRPPAVRVRRLAESLTVLRSLLDTGAATLDGEFHHIALDDLGVRPIRDHVPILIGGHGRQVIGLAARFADIVQFTGLTRGEGGVPTPGGFALDDIRRRARWIDESERSDAIERSALIQVLHVGDDADTRLTELTKRFGTDRRLLEETPFVLAGSLEQVVDKVERLRSELGISHLVIRDAEQFAPVVAALAGR